MALRLGIDIDGVLADFRNAFRETARECLRRDVGSDAGGEASLTHVDIDRVWNHIARRPNWWITLRAYEPAEIARLYALARAQRWEVCFLTKRPASGGDTVQFQTQWWLEQQGFYLPAVLTVPGSRGDLANALRLDLAIDDQFVNCAEIIAAGPTKALLMLRDPSPAMQQHAMDRGVGVVSTLAETLPILEQLQDVVQSQRGKMIRLSEWFRPKASEMLPQNPRTVRPIPDDPESAKPVP